MVNATKLRQSIHDIISACCGAAAVGIFVVREYGEQGGALQQAAFKATSLMYPVDMETGETRYLRGEDDVYLIGFLAMFLTFLRAFLAKVVFRPIGYAMGAREEDLHKFGPGGVTFLWFVFSFISGLLLSSGEWDIWDLSQMWEGYPHTALSAGFKLYYLLQAAYWPHQMIVTFLEEWRSDFAASMAHHILTSGLVMTSYWCHFTRVGTLILVEQDLADIIFAGAKLFKYATWQTCADVCFALFAVAWIVTRHGIFFCIYYEIFRKRQDMVLNLNSGAENGGYLTIEVLNYFLIALGLFQCLMLFWLSSLLKAIYRMAVVGHIEDTREQKGHKQK